MEGEGRDPERDVPANISREMGITAEEIADRKAFHDFQQADVERLTSIRGLAEQYAAPVIEAFYNHLMSFDVGKQFFQDKALLERIKLAQKDYFLGLTRGDYGPGYVENRLMIGAAHERVGLPAKAYLGMYSFYLCDVSSRLFEAYPDDTLRALRIFQSLIKLVLIDMGLAIDTYVIRRETTIRQQQEVLRQQEVVRAWSTPVLPVREGLLILPVVGQIDTARARQLTEQLLKAIRSNRAKVVVMDITGVPFVDSRVANHLVQTVEASRLMGATVIVTGLAPEIAQTLVVLGIDLTMMLTVGDLRGGIEEAERLLGSQTPPKAA